MSTRKNIRQSQRQIIALAAALTFIASVVVTLCVAVVNRGDAIIQEQTHGYLEEVSAQVSRRIAFSLESNLNALVSISDNFSEFAGPLGVESAYLARAAERHPFYWIGVVDGSGLMAIPGGGTLDLSGEPAVQTAIAGSPAISGTLVPCPDEEDSVLFAVPAGREGRSEAALAAWASPAALNRQLFGIETFGGEGFSHIIDLQGNFILHSENRNAVLGTGNFFESLAARGELLAGDSLEAMRLAMLGGETGYLEFLLDGSVRETLNYTPLNGGQWYLLSIVPTAVYTDSMQVFTQFSLLASCIISLLFLTLIAGMLVTTIRKNREITKIAFEDPVTGGFTVTRFDTALRERLAGFTPFAFVSLDIRKFKLINDAYGSEEGDRVLRHVHGVLLAGLKPGEFLSRVTSDRFNLILNTTSQERIRQILSQVTEEINAYNSLLLSPYFLPIDCGVYIVNTSGLKAVAIRDRANTARKKAKEISAHSLCKCVFYDDMERLQLLREREMENSMAQALENGEFVVYLQPKVSLETGKTIAAEALVRWMHPKKGLIPPSEFIPLFEKNGFILKLDRYVFEEVCKLLRRWIDAGLEAVPVSVNLSRAHLEDPGFLSRYQAVQQRYAVPPSLLEIELTETLVFENLTYLKQVVRQIHAMGFRCSMDDFGSGYSSLNVLREVSVDALKLDRAFFGEEKDGRWEDVVASVVDLAKKLGMATIAEGVESPSQVEFLRSIHCDAVQGYIFSKPLCIADFEARTFAGNGIS